MNLFRKLFFIIIIATVSVLLYVNFSNSNSTANDVVNNEVENTVAVAAGKM